MIYTILKWMIFYGDQLGILDWPWIDTTPLDQGSQQNVPSIEPIGALFVSTTNKLLKYIDQTSLDLYIRMHISKFWLFLHVIYV